MHYFEKKSISWLMENLKKSKINFPVRFYITLRAFVNRVVFKWLSKVMTRLRLLCLVIGYKEISRQFLNQWEAKPKAIASCTHDRTPILSKLQEMAGNSDWFIALFAPIVIVRSNSFWFWCFGVWCLVFWQSFKKRCVRLSPKGKHRFPSVHRS